MKVDGMAFTHSLCERDRGGTRGMTITYPFTPSPCICKQMEWHAFNPLIQEKENESKVMPSTHSLPLCTKVDGLASTRCLYKRRERDVTFWAPSPRPNSSVCSCDRNACASSSAACISARSESTLNAATCGTAQTLYYIAGVWR